jgi:hypothetical protein
MDSLIAFLQRPGGRLTRVIVGIAIIALGALALQGVWSIVVMLIGLIPLLAGAFGVCLIGPLFGYTLTGQKHSSLPHSS